MKKFTANDFGMLLPERRKKVTDWMDRHDFVPDQIHFIEQVHYEDDPILENVNLLVWTLINHRYVFADGRVVYIYEQDDFGDLVYSKYAEMETDDFPWEVLE